MILQDYDDKGLVIVAVTALGLCAMILTRDVSVVTTILAGLFGLATGRKA